MKIGILTFHRPINYGAFLQAFAFSKKLLSSPNVHSVEIIDYIAPLEKKKIFINVLWGIKHYGVKNGFRDLEKIAAFHKAYSTLNLSERSCFKTLTDLYKFIDDHYDVLIIGSDAVFNWNQNGYPTAFIPLYDFKRCKIISYAASVHGLKYFDEPQERINECGRAFSKMPFIGVRDSNTEKFVHYCCEQGRTAHCCDPTVMIDVDELKLNAGNFESRIWKKYKCNLSKQYIVLMMPDGAFTKKINEKYSKDFQIITLFKPSQDANYYLYDLNPFEWALVLSKASMVITSYFHGTLLALKQNTPVLSVDFSNYNDENYEGKLRDLLCTRLNLPEFYIDGNEVENEETQKVAFNIIDRAIAGDYAQRIEKTMQREATSGEQFCSSLEEIVADCQEQASFA